MQGASLDIVGDGLLIAENTAGVHGGGMFFAAPVNIKGGHAWVRDNAAVEGDGGGLWGGVEG